MNSSADVELRLSAGAAQYSWLVAGGWWLVAGGWWLVARVCGAARKVPRGVPSGSSGLRFAALSTIAQNGGPEGRAERLQGRKVAADHEPSATALTRSRVRSMSRRLRRSRRNPPSGRQIRVKRLFPRSNDSVTSVPPSSVA